MRQRDGHSPAVHSVEVTQSESDEGGRGITVVMRKTVVYKHLQQQKHQQSQIRCVAKRVLCAFFKVHTHNLHQIIFSISLKYSLPAASQTNSSPRSQDSGFGLNKVDSTHPEQFPLFLFIFADVWSNSLTLQGPEEKTFLSKWGGADLPVGTMYQPMGDRRADEL